MQVNPCEQVRQTEPASLEQLINANTEIDANYYRILS